MLPRLGKGGDSGDVVTLKASVTVQKKLLVLDLSDLVADSGDDLAELLGQHVSIQLVSTEVDPSECFCPSGSVWFPNWFVLFELRSWRMFVKMAEFGEIGAVSVAWLAHGICLSFQDFGYLKIVPVYLKIVSVTF